MSRIRALVVDDETPARRAVRIRLEEEPDVDVVGEAASGPEAVDAIERLEPDLVFLDVQMPGMNGFEVLEQLDRDRLPGVVFVTAYDRYAVRAFEVHALDYLLKPFDRDRFREALERARGRLRTPPSADGLREALRELERHRPTRIRVREGRRDRLVDVESVDWIEADGNYARLHVGPKEHLVRETLALLAERLKGMGFLRIHRSYLVNLDRIQELRPEEHGEWAAVLEDGTRLRISRSYRDAVFRRFL